MRNSRVKVNVSKENLVKALEDKKAELLKPEEKKKVNTDPLISSLHKIIELVESNKGISSHKNKLERQLREYSESKNDYDRSFERQSKNRRVEDIDRQLKFIRLSSDTSFAIGINDELYYLL